jgi:hypothetical protein
MEAVGLVAVLLRGTTGFQSAEAAAKADRKDCWSDDECACRNE